MLSVPLFLVNESTRRNKKKKQMKTRWKQDENKMKTRWTDKLNSFPWVPFQWLSNALHILKSGLAYFCAERPWLWSWQSWDFAGGWGYAKPTAATPHPKQSFHVHCSVCMFVLLLAPGVSNFKSISMENSSMNHKQHVFDDAIWDLCWCNSWDNKKTQSVKE